MKKVLDIFQCHGISSHSDLVNLDHEFSSLLTELREFYAISDSDRLREPLHGIDLNFKLSTTSLSLLSTNNGLSTLGKKLSLYANKPSLEIPGIRTFKLPNHVKESKSRDYFDKQKRRFIRDFASPFMLLSSHINEGLVNVIPTHFHGHLIDKAGEYSHRKLRVTPGSPVERTSDSFLSKSVVNIFPEQTDLLEQLAEKDFSDSCNEELYFLMPHIQSLDVSEIRGIREKYRDQLLLVYESVSTFHNEAKKTDSETTLCR